MKKSSFNRLLAWLVKIVAVVSVILMVLGVLVYLSVNSSWVVQKAADTFAPDYNITYSRIHGNVFTGLQIENPSYNLQPLAKQITLKWNPNALVQKEIHINTVKIQDANVSAILALVASFENNETNTSSKEPSPKSASMPTHVLVEEIQITLMPLHYKPVDVHGFKFVAKEIGFDIEKNLLDKGKLSLHAETNFGSVAYKFRAEANHLNGILHLTPSQTLYDTYALPLNKEAVGELVVDVNASPKQITATLSKTIKQLLKADEGAFNLDIDSLSMVAVYDVAKAGLQVDTQAVVATPYAKDINVSNHFTMDDTIAYSGDVSLKQLIGLDAKLVKPLNDLHLEYEGTGQNISVKIRSKALQGTFVSDDFNSAHLHLKTPEALMLSDMVSLPAELNQTKATLQIDMPMHFDANASYAAQVNINSNVVNVDANVSYQGSLGLQALATIPQNSLLKGYSKALKWDRISPVVLDAKLGDKQAQANVKAGIFRADARYGLEDTSVDGVVTLGGLKANITGKTKETMSIKATIASLPALFKHIAEVYTLEQVPEVTGSAELGIDITELKKINASLTSPHIGYQADKKTLHTIDKLALSMSMEEGKIQIPNYDFTYNEQRLFATKPSTVTLGKDAIRISPLWVNDALQVSGEYNLKTQKGTIDTTAQRLHIDHELAAIDSSVNLQTQLDGNKTAINGKVTLLGGNILYDLGQKNYASDSDILIVQEMKKQEESVFMDNLSVGVQVKTDKPFVYHQDAINIEAMVDLSIHKAEHADLMVVGSVEILQGGTYLFEGKKFVLGKSYVYFTGDPNKPLVEASVKYKSLNHLITITITGSANTPNIDFSSVPKLSKEEILSVILFDSEGGAGTNSSEDMMKMMGGAMAKSALSDLGVELDHLVLGASGSVEVGKKLSDNITVIYINGILPVVKVKYKHSEHTESVLGASEESQSYDIIYKKDF